MAISIKYPLSDIETVVNSFLTNLFKDNNDNPTLEVVNGYQNEWRSGQEYLSFRVNTPIDTGLSKQNVIDNGNDTFTIEHIASQFIEVRVDFLGSNAFNNYEILKQGLFMNGDDLDFLGVQSFAPQAIDNTALEKEEWLQRATGSFTLSLEQVFTDIVDVIEEVETIINEEQT